MIAHRLAGLQLSSGSDKRSAALMPLQCAGSRTKRITAVLFGYDTSLAYALKHELLMVPFILARKLMTTPTNSNNHRHTNNATERCGESDKARESYAGIAGRGKEHHHQWRLFLCFAFLRISNALLLRSPHCRLSTLTLPSHDCSAFFCLHVYDIANLMDPNIKSVKQWPCVSTLDEAVYIGFAIGFVWECFSRE